MHGFFPFTQRSLYVFVVVFFFGNVTIVSQYDYYNYPPNGAPQFVMGTGGNQGTTTQQHQQPGGGGPSLVQPPGSPPRQQQQQQHHHTGGGYGGQQQQQQQQLPPPYNAADVYFNFPMYGPMEGPTVYADGSLDLANGNPYAEVRELLLFDIEVLKT